jgi:DNA-binding beta-propeller fold protein YncE
MEILDCRNMTGRAAVNFIVKKYNALTPGAKLQAHIRDYEMEFRGGMLERGLRHREFRADDGSWQINVEREQTTAQGSTSGLHHVIANAEGDVWTCRRAPIAARLNVNSKRAEVAAPILQKGSHLAFDPAGRRVIIPDPAAGELVAVRENDLHVEQRWKVPGSPQFAAVSDDGVVITTGEATLTIVRPIGGDFETQTLTVGAGAHDPVIGRNGDYAFVPCALEHDLVKVRLSDGKIMGRTSVGYGLAHTTFDPNTGRLYVASSWDGTLFAVSEDGVILAQAESGGWAHAIDITPDGRWVWVANFLDDTVAVFDASSLQRKALLATDPYPHGLNISPDGARAVITGYSSSYVRVYDAVTWQELAHIEVGAGPSHTAFIPGSSIAAVGCSVDDHVACIDVNSGTLLDKISLEPAVH